MIYGPGARDRADALDGACAAAGKAAVPKGRYDEAPATLRRVDPRGDARARLDAIEADLAGGEQGRFREMFTRRYARATFFVIAFGFFVQITGNNTVLFYGPTIFRTAGISGESDSLLVSALVQAVAALGVVLSMLVVDRWGGGAVPCCSAPRPWSSAI
ncbi:hypothetical protein GCM10009801_75140 [Streptomyces albiaxialis]|uniref:Major facilitator superfamily (MFS) profile domain-containing protein n=1 Tax=Streptomyces albiaxialis TaxID=329523 RepID=A0ABP5INT2_9ACTN